MKNRTQKRGPSPFIRYWIKDPFWGAIDHLLQGGIRLLPVETASALGERLGRLASVTRFRHLAPRVSGNLKRINPDMPEAECSALAESMWRHLGRTLVEITMLDRLRDPRYWKMENEQLLLAHTDRRRPVVFLFPHLANWEMISVALQALKLPVRSVIEQMRNRFQRRLIWKTRTALGYDMITPDFAGVRKMHETLQNGGGIGLAVDEFVNGNVIAPAFGRNIRALTNIGRAVKLAKRYDAALAPAYCLRTGPVRFTVTFCPVVEPSSGDEAALEARLNAMCEDMIRTHPDQWYMLHRMRLRQQ